MIDLHGFGTLLLKGSLITAELACAAMLVALILGMLGAQASLSRHLWARGIAGVYTSLVRGIPELLMILVVYFGSSMILMGVAGWFGYTDYIELSPFVAGTIALGFMYGAYATEAIRGAIQAIPRGQTEAGQALGMRRAGIFFRIVLPQAWRLALPPLGNLLQTLLKDTALISVIGANDLMRSADIAVSKTREPFTFYAVATLIYLGLTLLSMLLSRWLEQRANRGIEQATA